MRFLSNFNLPVAIFLTLILSISCNNNIPKKVKIENLKSKIDENQTIVCEIVALDLSENLSRISTKNDELILLIYQNGKTNDLPNLIFQEYFVLDSLDNSNQFSFNISEKTDTILTFVLIEMDSKKTLEQIEPVVRINLDNMYETKISEEKKSITKFLGDDDLLGIEKIYLSDFISKNSAIVFEGVKIFDWYNYEILIKM